MRWDELTSDLFPEAVQKAEGVCLLLRLHSGAAAAIAVLSRTSMTHVTSAELAECFAENKILRVLLSGDARRVKQRAIEYEDRCSSTFLGF